MKCETVRKLLNDYIENNLTEGLSSMIYEHILDCSRCADEENELRAIIKALSFMPKKCASQDFTKQVMAKLPSHESMNTAESSLSNAAENSSKAEAGVMVTLASRSGAKFMWIGTEMAARSVSFVKYMPRPTIRLRIGKERTQSLTKMPLALGFRW